VYVANQGSNTVTVIDSVTLAVLATIPVGLQPIAAGMFIGPDVPPALPDAPGNVVATAGNAQATVSFSAPADHGSAIIS
jgi:YVTN family beta-propeller protein